MQDLCQRVFGWLNCWFSYAAIASKDILQMHKDACPPIVLAEMRKN